MCFIFTHLFGYTLMSITKIPFKETNYFSSLICDYLDQKSALKPFYNRFPVIENFKDQIKEKQASFMASSRNRLYDSIVSQYKNVQASEATQANISALKKENTFTITTGHQLNLFTGPLYFIYKIACAIRLCEELSSEFPKNNFVPVYWMASEDHDFDEINYFKFKGKKIQWNREASGAVGELDLAGLDEVAKVLEREFGNSQKAKDLKQLFANAYLNHENLADATRYLANELFKDYGLIIVDGNDSKLKHLFAPFVENELLNQTAFKKVSETNELLKAVDTKYKIQVNPREVNLFYLTEGLRERIVFENDVYKVVNTDISWSQSDILNEVAEFPERFSPNALLRPLYQEVILPNLCYIGGGGELAYWLQLKSYFEAVKVPFPILLLRNSMLLATENQKEKLTKLSVTFEDLFLNREELRTQKTKQISKIDIDFSSQIAHLKKQFEDLYELADKTDKSFLGAVAAQEKKQLKGLQHLEKRLLKAQKRKLADELDRVSKLQESLFLNNSLQERNANFSEFYIEYGERLVTEVVKNIDPLDLRFSILTL